MAIFQISGRLLIKVLKKLFSNPSFNKPNLDNKEFQII